MNEVTLHRGRHPHLTIVDAYFDNQHLTEAVVCPSSLEHT
jgi:NADH kinase